MLPSRPIHVLAAVLLVAALAGCARAGGGTASTAAVATGAAQATSTTASGAPSTPVPYPGPVPVVFVHGITSDPVENWGALLPRLARGRQVFAEMYPAESDSLPTGSVRRDSIFAVGYYRESASAPNYYADRYPQLSSIGGCPVPRSDPMAGRYTTSYAAQLDRAVENICRATGSERVDLVCYSMGGIVGRAYTRWLSLKAPGGGSRVRRLLTVGTMNHGLNSLEATTLVAARGGAGPHLAQGEAAELNYQCAYWGGRSFIDLLNEDWDGFCSRAGVEYAAGYGRGNSIFESALLQYLMTQLNGAASWLVPLLLVHPTPGFDLAAAGAEAMEDGDGVVRVSSSRFDPARYPGARFNAEYYGTHMKIGADTERAMFSSTWIEELVRRFVLEGRTGGGGSAATGSVRVVDAGGEASWLALDLDVSGGEPLAAQVLLRTTLGQLLAPYAPPFGVGTYALGLPLRRGAQSLMLDPAGVPDGTYGVEVRLFGIDGVVQLTSQRLRIARAGRPTAAHAVATIGAPAAGPAGSVDFPLTLNPTGGEVRWALDDGSGGDWSAPIPAGIVSLPALLPGSYELRVRAAGASNAAGLKVENARPAAVRFDVDAAGQAVARP
jgi:hypothetical protein